MGCSVSLSKSCHLKTPLLSSPERSPPLSFSAFYTFQACACKEARMCL